MKTKIAKALSLLLTLIFLFSVIAIPCSALTYRTAANSASQSYMDSVYYQNLSYIPLTGDNRTDVLAVALSQLGYQEGDSDGQYSGTVSGSNNYTEYNRNIGTWDPSVGYGGSSYEWCASFVSFCLFQAGCHDYTRLTDWCREHTDDQNYVWKELSCSRWATQLRKYGYFQYSHTFGGSYTPIYGDLIFFTSSGNKDKESHIGLVLWADNSKVYTVEGNTNSVAGLETNGGGVYFKSHDLASTYISGYGILPYISDDNVEKIDYSGANMTTGLYVAATNDKHVYADASDSEYSWILPKYSVLAVTEVVGNGVVKVKCKIDERTVTGYVKNDTDRIIQLTTTIPEFEPDPPPPALEPPTLLNYSESSVTLEPAEGREYKMGDGEWQTSSIFTGLKSDVKYLFYQRDAENAETESEPLEICIDSLFENKKLSNLSITDCTLSPKFDPSIYKYSLSVPSDLTELEISASASNGSVATVAEYSFDENGKATIIIIVTPTIGAPRIYTLDAQKEGFEKAPAEESESDTVTDTTEQVTDATNATTDIAVAESGCKSSLGENALTVILLLSLASAVVIKKKKTIKKSN